MKITKSVVLLCVLLGFTSLANAFEELAAQARQSNANNSDMNIAMLRIALDKLLPGIKPETIRETPIKGLYEVTYQDPSSIFYFNRDASYMFRGDLIDMTTRTNITEQTKSKARSKLIQAVSEDKMVVFKAKNEKYQITVFTDVDCPYCKKLHHEIAQYNQQGITIRYMAYPRAGIGSGSYKKMVSIWCSKDKNKAMTDAKNDRNIPELECDNPVAEQFALGQKLGVRGTPAIFLQDGTMLPGYIPAARLAQELQFRQSAR